MHAARALLYVRMTTGNGHPGVCDHCVVFDRWQMKTVVLLYPDCDFCRCGDGTKRWKKRRRRRRKKDFDDDDNNIGDECGCDDDVLYIADLIARMFCPPDDVRNSNINKNKGETTTSDIDTSMSMLSPLIPFPLRLLIEQCFICDDNEAPTMMDLCDTLTKCLNGEIRGGS